MSIITNLDGLKSSGTNSYFAYYPFPPFKTLSGSEFFTSSGKLSKEGNNFIFGFCKFKDKIANIPEKAKIKVRSRLDDFTMVFVKHENIITQYGFCVNFNEEIGDFEFLCLYPQGCNSRISA